MKSIRFARVVAWGGFVLLAGLGCSPNHDSAPRSSGVGNAGPIRADQSAPGATASPTGSSASQPPVAVNRPEYKLIREVLRKIDAVACDETTTLPLGQLPELVEKRCGIRIGLDERGLAFEGKNALAQIKLTPHASLLDAVRSALREEEFDLMILNERLVISGGSTAEDTRCQARFSLKPLLVDGVSLKEAMTKFAESVPGVHWEQIAGYGGEMVADEERHSVNVTQPLWDMWRLDQWLLRHSPQGDSESNATPAK